jgi:hypothetical protein
MRRNTLILLSHTVVCVGIATVAACSSGDSDLASGRAATLPPLDAASSTLPTESSPPAVYVAKVKNVLVGLPPTDDEVKAVEADPSKLGDLIDGWMKLPEYEAKMLRFFQLAFQQTQVDISDFADQTYPRVASNNATTTPLLLQNATESFARTVLALVAAGRPLTEAMTTRSLMMTPPLMEFYAYLDSWQVDDSGKVTDRFRAAHPDQTITVTSAEVPLAETVDPASPNFMHWHNPDLAKLEAAQAGCGTDPVVFDTKLQTGSAVHRLIQGSFDPRPPCGGFAGSANAGQFAAEDYADWKMVTIRPPMAGEAPTPFYDIPRLRMTSELLLLVPRVGFFSTPAFFANWQTNESNQMRVTANQMLIVALGSSVDGTDTTAPTSTPGLDSTHAANPACLSCHQTLDPTRSILAASWSWNYHDQDQTAFSSQPGVFAFRGVTKPVGSLDDLGAALASHPLFAQAWVQKLCFYANSRACQTDDPEFVRIVSAFQSSNYAWPVLVRELLASPLTTNARPTKTSSDQGELVAVSRRDHFCADLDHRLHLVDVCGLVTSGPPKNWPLATIAQIAAGLPSDGYGRGSVAPVLPNQPTLFYRAATENVCEAVAAIVVDGAPDPKSPNGRRWSSTAAEEAMDDFVGLVMGLVPSDPRAVPARAVLASHYSAATASGASAADALRSTFVLACLSPSSLSIGL